jgi:DNA-binding Lrp family transcriptional regulator
MRIDDRDRRLIAATQAGLPLVAEPYREIAHDLGLDEAVVMARLSAMQQSGIIRRIAVAPNHYALGLVANGMTVWDVTDEVAIELGNTVGALDFVSHCYLRPRALPDWPYNLFAMVHGVSRDEVATKRNEIRTLLGNDLRADDILYSTRILKKTGLRLGKG